MKSHDRKEKSSVAVRRPCDSTADAVATEGFDVSTVISWSQGHSRSSICCQLWSLSTHLCRVSVFFLGPV